MCDDEEVRLPPARGLLAQQLRSSVVRVSVVDWQVSFQGSAAADLCYLLYSSSTCLFRRIHADELMEAHFHRLLEVARALGVGHRQFAPTFRDFDEEFQKVIIIVKTNSN